MLARVNEVIDLYVRPQIKEHGGDVEVVSVENGIVTVRLTGNCSGCPAAGITVEGIIKSELIRRIPDVKDVELEVQVSQDMMDFAKKILNRNS